MAALWQALALPATILLTVILLSFTLQCCSNTVILLNVNLLSVILLCVILLSFIMLNVILLSKIHQNAKLTN